MATTTDPDFREFLNKIQDTNRQSLGLQLLQVKAEREVAGEDDDRREEQLDNLIEAVKNLGSTLTGQKININVQPVVDELGNQTKILLKSLEELTISRKISEGSLEYDKASAQYRNVSGREVESVVSGKAIKQGGYIDFESAADRLTGQGSRVRESNKLQLIAPGNRIGATASRAIAPEPKVNLSGFKLDEENISWGMVGREIASKLGFGRKDYSPEQEHYGNIYEREGQGTKEQGMDRYNAIVRKEQAAELGIKTGVNPEADNVTTSDEIIADTAKADLEITKEQKDLLELQLVELRGIKEALSPDVPAMMKKSAVAPIPGQDLEEKDSGGIDVGLPGGAGGRARGKKGKVGKLGKAARGLGRLAGPLALAYGAYEVGSAAINTEEYLDLEEGQKPTIGQRVAAGTGALAEAATFGLVDGRELGNILAQTPEGKRKALENQRAVGDISVGEVSEFAGMEEMITPSPAKSVGAVVNNLTNELNNKQSEINTAIRSAPSMISNSTNNITKNNFVPMKPQPRTSSSLDKHLSEIVSYN